jgi:tRNA-binding EMAP/Myf-like protein
MAIEAATAEIAERAIMGGLSRGMMAAASTAGRTVTIVVVNTASGR